MGQIISFAEGRRILRKPAARPVEPPAQPELVAALLLALEDNPLAPLAVWLSRRLDGGCDVGCRVATAVFVLAPDAARLAAHALFAEQAFVGCVAASLALIDAAERAELTTWGFA